MQRTKIYLELWCIFVFFYIFPQSKMHAEPTIVRFIINSNPVDISITHLWIDKRESISESKRNNTLQNDSYSCPISVRSLECVQAHHLWAYTIQNYIQALHSHYICIEQRPNLVWSLNNYVKICFYTIPLGLEINSVFFLFTA